MVLAVGFEQAAERTSAALRQADLGIISEIDAKDTLRKKIGIDVRSHRIHGARDHSLAYAALRL